MENADGTAPLCRAPARDRRLLARRQLPVGRADLSDGQPAPQGEAAAGAHQAAPLGPFRHDAGAQPRLRSSEPDHQTAGSQYPLRHRSGPRCARHPCQSLARGHLQRNLPARPAERGRDAAAVHAVLVPRRRAEPHRGGDAGLDQRRGRARLFAAARLRRGLRQSRSDRLRRHRRRRGRDRGAGRQLAFEQVPQPGARRRGAADPASERLQDCRTDRAGAHRRGGTGQAPRRLRLRAAFRERPRAAAGAPADGGNARPGLRPDPGNPDESPNRRGRGTAALAADRAEDAERLDLPEDRRRPAGRGQVPRPEVRTNPEHLRLLEEWMKSYRPEELFDREGRPVPALAALVPGGERRMGANPHANGGRLLRELDLPDFRDYAVAVPRPGGVRAEATRIAGRYLRDVLRRNAESRNFRVMGPDETASNRLDALFEATDRVSVAEILPGDDHVSRDGRVMEVLSEHLCQGWLEGYLLTGRHGFFSCYEAFIHIVDSMFNQHAKWLKTIRRVPWRRPIASLNYLLTSHVWRQDHNGFSHQDPGFIDHVVNKKAEVVRIYLPPDANTLLSVVDHCLRSRNYVNVIVAGKQPEWQWLDIEAAARHCTVGLGIWSWASNDAGVAPDVVMACAGDVPTLETLAAVDFLRTHLPDLKIRVVNVVDLMTLQPPSEHPHGLSDREFDSIFTPDKPIIFAFHGYPWLIHRLTYRRTNHRNLHVRGYKEEGTTTTPFDMTVLNELDRFHLASDVIDRVPRIADIAGHVKQLLRDKLVEHRRHVERTGEDLPEVRDWRWPLPDRPEASA